MYTNPTVAEFKAYFFRDFPYATDANDLTKVQDQDITNAFLDVDLNLNPEIVTSQEMWTSAYLNLGAHFLVTNLRNSSQGLAGQYGWLQASRGAGSVSESVAIPQKILDNPQLAMLAKTNYGAKYLMLILPQMLGQMFSVCGATQP